MKIPWSFFRSGNDPGGHAMNAWLQTCNGTGEKSSFFRKEATMPNIIPDIVYCLMILAFFGVAWLMVRACDRL
jgi:hypothetical protein